MIDSLKIGAVTYAVKEIEDLHSLDNEDRKKNLHGQILYNEAVIKVDADQDAQLKVATLWHEAMHGILDQAGHFDHPENLIIALGYGLVQIIKDNPALVALTIGERVAIVNTWSPSELSKGQNEMLDLEARHLIANGYNRTAEHE